MSAPPANCIGAMRSPRKIAASATVTAGSTVDSVDARVGPMRFNPAKNPKLTDAQAAEVKKYRADGESLHKAGKHQESVDTLAKAMKILDVK